VSLLATCNPDSADFDPSADFHDHLGEYHGIAPSSQIKFDSAATPSVAVRRNLVTGSLTDD